jgi:DNA-directed RNA polymerase subunit RPC12/RpoP
MKKQFCGQCGKETWHNPCRDGKTFRCVECGRPFRIGNKYTGKIGGKIMNVGKA